jgi:hypothetical protein
VLNGGKKNFFTKKESQQAQEIFTQLFNHYAKNKKSN